MKFASLCSGVGGFDIGFEAAGMFRVFQCERDKDARSVLMATSPGTETTEDVNSDETSESLCRLRPDLLCFGFPCQDLSVAGKRAGLAGERSGLFFRCASLAAECNARWLVIENVPGLLSSNGGRDMGIVLGTLGELGYRWAYRVLDAQYFGVAQRRRRVFIVGHLGDGADPAEILFDAASLSRNPPTRGEAGARVAVTLTAGTSSGGGVSKPGRRREDDSNLVCAAVAPCLRSGNQHNNSDPTMESQMIVAALSAHGVGTCGADDNQGQAGHLLPIPIDMRQASRGEKMTNNRGEHAAAGGAPGTGIGEPGDPSPSIGLSHPPAVAFNWQGGGTQTTLGYDPDSRVCGSLHVGQTPAVATEWTVRRLLPIECERLMGWPDGWTLRGHDGRLMSDSARYRMCGNGVVGTVSKWIGRRLMEAAT